MSSTPIKMPTQRPPFFASFLGAFRARTIPTFQAKSSVSPVSTLSSTANVSISTTNATSSTARSLATTTSTSAASAGDSLLNIGGNSTSVSQSIPQQTSSSSTHKPTNSAFSATATSPFSTSPGTGHHHHHPYSHSPFYSPRSPVSGSSSPPPGQTTSLPYASRGRQRRGSDSSNSSGGFMDALGSGGEKWYIGGRTPGGDERFYRLGMVTAGGTTGTGRATSLDRLSL